MKSTKILIVVDSIDIEDSSGSKANVALIENLNKIGCHLKVLHYTRKKIDLPGIDCVNIPEDRRSFLFLASRIERYFRKYLKIKLYKPIENTLGFSFTLFNDKNSIVSFLKKEIEFSPSWIITLSKGGSFRPHHAMLKMPELYGKWLAYIHDPYPMTVFPPPYTYKEPGWKYKFQFIERVFERARYIAFPSELLKDWMSEFYKLECNKGVVIPHQISKVAVEQIKVPAYFDENNFNVLHAGNLLWGRDPMGLIGGFKKFIASNPCAKKNARLIFLGGKNHYSTELQKFKREMVQFYVSEKYVGHAEVLAMQKKAAVNVILEAKSDISPFLPGKFPHCVMANKPILLLGPPKSEAKRLLGEDFLYHSGINEVDSIAQKLELLYLDWQKNSNKNLDRQDLEEYMSETYLKTILQNKLGIRL